MFLRVFLTLLLLSPIALADAPVFRAGAAVRDITPEAPMPMWGYGARHDLLSQGTLDPLRAKAIVLEAGGEKLAVVGLDLGRAPTFRSMDRIREAVQARAGVQHVMICGSHTHHGPVIELLDKPGLGQGKFDDAVAYVPEMEDLIIEAVVEAAEAAVPARWGWASMESELNRNRHAPDHPKPIDRELAVLRFDTLEGAPIAILVNFAAHPVIHSVMDRRWTADFPGPLQDAVEETLGVPCVFVQGAAGDLSPNRGHLEDGIEPYGRALAEQVLELNARLETEVPATPSIRGMDEAFDFQTRLDLHDPLIQGALSQAFFPEMLAILDEIPADTIHPRLVTMLINEELALVGGSGEFFAAHATRLKEQSPAPKTLFFGYCNGHQMYFPTLLAIEQGGYGTAPSVCWVEPGAGEAMIDRALENLRALAGG